MLGFFTFTPPKEVRNSMATTLDAAYFSAHPSPPWVLPLDNEVYTLTVDVDASGTYGGGELFKLTGTNSELDTNGHFIRYNGQDIKQSTRGGDRLNVNDSEYEVPAQNIDQLGSNHEWENPQDDGDRQASDTGGRAPNVESGTGVTPNQPHGGETQTGRS